MTDGQDDVSFFVRPGFERVGGRRWMVVRFAVGAVTVLDMLPNQLTCCVRASTWGWPPTMSEVAMLLAPPGYRVDDRTDATTGRR